MKVTKCDLCKKQVKEGDKAVSVYYGFYNHREFCKKCAEPVLKFLKNKKLLKEEDK